MPITFEELFKKFQDFVDGPLKEGKINRRVLFCQFFNQLPNKDQRATFLRWLGWDADAARNYQHEITYNGLGTKDCLAKLGYTDVPEVTREYLESLKK